MASRHGARGLLDRVLDPDTFRSWDTPPVDVRPGPAYAAELARARRVTGCDEAVLTGEGLLRGRRVAVAVTEFRFLAGSLGVAAAERLAAAVERATAEGLPLLVAPSSGGTRMQEGAVAFLSMAKIAGAVTAHKAAGLPYLVYLRHPTTGGVLASWGSLGHVTFAEPGALVGFLGPRVHRALYDRELPEGVQRAENLHEHGLVDAVLAADELPDLADRVLSVLCARDEQAAAPDPGRAEDAGEVAPAAADEGDAGSAADARAALPSGETAGEAHPTWAAVLRSRRKDRPGVRALLRRAATGVTPLRGSGEGETDPGLMLALARFEGSPCVLLGQDREGQTEERPMGPAALRTARRGLRLADELGLPLVTVVDTPGAELSQDAEEGGMAGQIARCLAELLALRTPTVALLLGQGTGGGALALIPADRVLSAQNAWLGPLPPEGASALVHRTVDRAPELAESQGIGAADLHRNGIVDRVIAELDDAADEEAAFCDRVGAALGGELAALRRRPADERRAERAARYRRLGLPT
ncbi:acetyl-CoA carboxylase carboxyl transferase subunit beta [Nocardiopsis sp. Huas11]|uniref:carboxyl transferase domain-containing protein n=1 Tax=Nocardiopsis sp. Huas11 TaxID=2183912 RepID=UPI000EB0149D|nr:carboxyl transferase domain-containing protein [Nocardiopsis sp. Huas11]RKS09165.1 acetyl-CoA carboxylase carboxyl transferase subunit beta [Nocardiopsis sp. Huas11]